MLSNREHNEIIPTQWRVPQIGLATLVAPNTAVIFSQYLVILCIYG